MAMGRTANGPDRDPVRTTIVGGQPKVVTKGGPPVPEGIERLLGRAAGDQSFRLRLLADRVGAARTAGIGLSASEEALLASVSAEQLEQLIAHAASVAPPRRHFLQTTLGWLAGAIGVSALAAGCKKRPQPGPAPTGVRPDVPDDSGPATRGIRPDVPTEKPKPSPGPVTKGIQPDVPPPKEEDQ
jgi:hypothetical protein